MQPPRLFGWGAFLGLVGAALSASVLVFSMFPALVTLFGMVSHGHVVTPGWALWCTQYAGPMIAVSLALILWGVRRAGAVSQWLCGTGVVLLALDVAAPAPALFLPGYLLAVAGVLCGWAAMVRAERMAAVAQPAS